jgi:hypothetical protein
MNNKYLTDSASQCNRLLSFSQAAPVTTIEVCTELEIMHPGGRVQDLKSRIYNIVTHWITRDTGKAKHRVAQYVLLSEV